MTEGDVLEPVQAALASGEPDPAGRKIVGMGVWPVARLDHHGVREFATDSGWRKLDVVRCLAGLLRQNRWALFSPLVFVLRGAMASQLPRLERPGATSPDFHLPPCCSGPCKRSARSAAEIKRLAKPKLWPAPLRANHDHWPGHAALVECTLIMRTAGTPIAHDSGTFHLVF